MKPYPLLAAVTALSLWVSYVPAFASSDSYSGQEDTYYMEKVLDNYRQYRDMPDGYLWLTDDSGYAYMNLAEHTRTDYYSHPLMLAAYTAMGELLTEEDCIGYLSVVMHTLDSGMSVNVTAQAKYDSAKNWKDYGIDAVSLAAKAVGLDETTEDLKYLQDLVGLSDATLEFFTSSLEQAEHFLVATQTYEEHKLFLETVAEYADNKKLKSAAHQLLELMQYRYLYALDTAASEMSAVGTWTRNAHESLITDSFKQWLSKGKGPDGKKYAALADKVIQSCKAIDLAAGISVLAGDIFIGNEYRYLKELMMMADISQALEKGINKKNPSLGDDLEGRYKLLKLQAPLLQSLCAVRTRGEYCASMLGQAHGTLFGRFAKDKDKAAAFYEQAISFQEREYLMISELFIADDFTVTLLWHCPQTKLTRSNGRPLSSLYGLYPEVSYPGKKAAMEKINNTLREGYERVTDSLLSDKSWTDPNTPSQSGSAGNTFSTQYLPNTRMDRAVISLLFEDAAWPEYALLPTSASRHYNFDPDTGSLLGLSDILEGDGAYKQLGDLLCREKPVYSYGMDLDDTLADMARNFWNSHTASDNPISWYFTWEGLNFTVHSVRDGINLVGDVSWEIPYEQLKGVLKDPFLSIQERSKKGLSVEADVVESVSVDEADRFVYYDGPGDGSFGLSFYSREIVYDVTIYGMFGRTQPMVTLSSLSPATAVMISCGPSNPNSPNLSVRWTDGSGNQRECLFGADSEGGLITRELR